MKRNLFIFLMLQHFILDTGAQLTYISSGTRITGTGGKTIFKTSLHNEGTYSNSSNLVIFTGGDLTIGGSSPVACDNITVDSGCNLNSESSGFTVHGVLSSNGLLNSSGNVILLSDSVSTALVSGISTGQITGTITMQRFIPSGFGYKYFSSPFQNSTVNEFADDLNLLSSSTAVYKYDENRTSSGWVYYKVGSNPLNPGAGYAVNMGNEAASKTVDIAGTVNNGTLTLTLYNHNNFYTKGFNLIGNPYPSPIDWDAETGWTKTNIDDAIYFFIAGATDQYSGTYSTYMAGISSDGIASNIIPSMQGFFVHVTDGAYPVTGTLGFTNDIRVDDMDQQFCKSGSKAEPSLLRLVAGYTDNALSYDPFVIYFNEKATFNFDGQLDALKLFNTDASVTNFFVFADDGNKLSINALPDVMSNGCVLKLGLKTSRSGEVEFKIKDITGAYLDHNLSLFDTVTGITTVLSGVSSYKISLPAGDYNNRFYLNLGNIITGIEDMVSEEPGFKVWCRQGVLKTEINYELSGKGTIYIHGLAGQLLFTEKVLSPGYHEFFPDLREGIYIVTFMSGKTRLSRKVVFRN